METADHWSTLLRYVARHPLRANRVARAADGRWSSLGLRPADSQRPRAGLAASPVPRPEGGAAPVHAPPTEAELTALRQGLARGGPSGSAGWSQGLASRLGLEQPLRKRGRPRKAQGAPDRFREE